MRELAWLPRTPLRRLSVSDYGAGNRRGVVEKRWGSARTQGSGLPYRWSTAHRMQNHDEQGVGDPILWFVSRHSGGLQPWVRNALQAEAADGLGELGPGIDQLGRDGPDLLGGRRRLF